MWSRLYQKNVPAAMNYLENNTPNTSSIIANLAYASSMYNPYTMRSGFYYIYKHHDKIDGIIAIYNDGNTFIYTNNKDAQISSLKVIFKGKFHSIWGLSNWLPNLKWMSSHLNMPMDSRELVTMERSKLIKLPDSKHTLLRIDKKLYLNKYIPFIKTCLYEGFGFEPYARDLKKRMRERSYDEPYFLLYDDSNPVCQAHIQSISKTYGYIAGICTPRKFRRMGYAKQITARCCRFVEEKNRTSALTVNYSNTSAVKLYENLGFTPVAKMQVYMKMRKFTGDENQ